MAMARGSLWAELGKDRERRRRAETARLRAEAQIRKDQRRVATMTRREALAHDRADGEAEAAALQADLDDQVAELCGLLRAVVAFPVPTIDELRDLVPPAESPPDPGSAPQWADYAPPEPGLLGRLLHGRAIAEARARFDAAFATFDRARSDAVAAHGVRIQQVRQEHRDRIDALVAAAHRGDPDAAPELAAAVLETVEPLRDLLAGGRGVHRPEARELVVEVELPGKEVIPAEREWRYVVGRRVVDFRPRPAREIAALYRNVVAQAALATLLVAFRAFPSDVLDVVTVNAHVQTTDPATGNAVHPCLVTVSAPRATVDGLQLDNPQLDAVECLNRLGAEISPNPYTAAAVTPFLDLDVLERYALITRPEDLAALDHRADLLQMDPYAFEALVVALFAALGYRTWRTRDSHDDGIDGLAISDDPHLPVECLIQVKRTRNRVNPKEVQALMGALAENPTATHAYLVTTSWFSDRTRQRGFNRRVRTMEGPELCSLIKDRLGRDVLISASPPVRR